MRPSVLKVVLRLVAAAGIPGIIAGSIAENDAVAITFGSITAVAALGLILVTAATSAPAADAIGETLEARIAGLVAAGADERDVRDLVGDAVRLGQQQQNS
ncbi:MAG TPA: hypothetical protein VFU93_07305 [Acidimicrobiales bacterium]|nr:hypothetical protein [Acidimicrobiales bacterium]